MRQEEYRTDIANDLATSVMTEVEYCQRKQKTNIETILVCILKESVESNIIYIDENGLTYTAKCEVEGTQAIISFHNEKIARRHFEKRLELYGMKLNEYEEMIRAFLQMLINK